ncbi:TolC family protein [Thermodesulfobacteriota bacterium]
MSWKAGIVSLILLMGLSGCVGGLVGKHFPSLKLSSGYAPSPRPLMKPVIGPPAGITGHAEANEKLTLARALWLAHIYNPALAVVSYESRVRDAKILQAGLKPNPEISAEVENFGGTGDTSGSESAETTITLSQLVPLGGKISKQVRVAGLDRDLSGWDYQAERLSVIRETAQRFIRVLMMQEILKVAREQVTLAEGVVDVSSKRYQAGDTTIVDRTRSEADLESSRIALQKTGFRLTAARQALAAMWGSPRPKFDHVRGNLFALREVPDWKFLASWISRNPDIARWATEMSKRWAELRLARSHGLPDLTLGFGVRRINQLEQQMEEVGKVPVPNDTALVAQLSLPIPAFDRNQGNLLAAKARLDKGEQERRAAWVRVQTALSQSYTQLLSAHTEASSIRDKVLPRLRSAFEGVSIGYRNGQLGYLDLLQSQRKLVLEQKRYIEALGAAHNAMAELEGLIGRPLGELR